MKIRGQQLKGGWNSGLKIGVAIFGISVVAAGARIITNDHQLRWQFITISVIAGILICIGSQIGLVTSISTGGPDEPIENAKKWEFHLGNTEMKKSPGEGSGAND